MLVTDNQIIVYVIFVFFSVIFVFFFLALISLKKSVLSPSSLSGLLGEVISMHIVVCKSRSALVRFAAWAQNLPCTYSTQWR